MAYSTKAQNGITYYCPGAGNTDFGDAYERESEDPSYFHTFSVNGYAIGIDVLLYAMTH